MIKSSFRIQFWFAIIPSGVVALGMIGFIVLYLVVNPAGYPRAEILAAFAIPAVVSWLLYKLLDNFLIRVILWPDKLEFHHLLTRKEIIFGYDDIIHVSNLHDEWDPDGPKPWGRYFNLKLAIELKTGEMLSFSDFQFDNYAELKDTIRARRFHLEEK